MPKVKSVYVAYVGGKTVYRAGDRVAGTVGIVVGEAFDVHGVRVHMYGESLVKWDESELSDDVIGKERYVGLINTVYGKKVNESGPLVSLTVGLHKYNFAFRLPNNALPSSFEGKYGATRYWIKVELHRPFPWPNIDRYKGFTVLADININEPQYLVKNTYSNEKTISKALGLGNVGDLKIQVGIDRKGYCPGEKIAITATFSNNSKKDLGKPRTNLIQEAHFIANGTKKTSTGIICGNEGLPLLKESSREWKDVLLTVDAIPPSSKPNCSHIIKVSYFLKVLVEVPLGFDLEIFIPVTIGTVPFGHKPHAASASSIAVVDASKAITYTECNKGICVFTGSKGVFPNFPYTPSCPFVSTENLASPSNKPADSTENVASPTNMPAASPQLFEKPSTAAPSSAVKKTAVETPAPHDLPPPYTPRAEPTTGATSSGDGPSEIRTVLLVIRFPKASMGLFGNKVYENQRRITTLGGKLLAVSTEVNVNEGAWNPDHAIAMFMFTTLQKGQDFIKVVDSSWFPHHDSFISSMTETLNEGKALYSITMSKFGPEAGQKMAKNPQLQAKVQSLGGTLVPIRMSMGGTQLVSSSRSQMVNGQWLSTGEIIRIVQWGNDQSCQQYRSTSLLVMQNTIPELMTDISRSMAITFQHNPELIVAMKSPPACLIVRFPKTRIHQMRNFFKENWETVEEMDGVPLAFAAKITFREEYEDDEKMALFFLMFPQAGVAKECFTKLNEIGANNQLTTCDVLLAEMLKDIEFIEDSKVFAVSYSKKTDETMEKLKKGDKELIAMFKDIQEKFAKARQEFGGVCLLVKEQQELQGAWKKDHELVTLMQWPSLDMYNQYIKENYEKREIPMTLLHTYIHVIWSGDFVSCSLFDTDEENDATEISEILMDIAI